MLIIHANDPTTGFLHTLYDNRDDISGRIDESSTNGDVIRALKTADRIMMLGSKTFREHLEDARQDLHRHLVPRRQIR